MRAALPLVCGLALGSAQAVALASASALAAAQLAAQTSAAAASGTSAQVPAPEPLGSDARQIGSGDYRWYGIRVYSAMLWSAGACSGDVYQRPLFLELSYAMRLKGADIARASVEQMAEQGAGSETQRTAWLAQMQRIFPDVRSGDTLAALYQPDTGLRFYAQRREIAAVTDQQFARAFLDIWLGPRSTAPALRRALLKGCGESDGRAG